MRRKKLRISWLFPFERPYAAHIHAHAYIYIYVLVVPAWKEIQWRTCRDTVLVPERECKMRPRDTTGDKRGDSRTAGLYQARKYNRDVSLPNGSRSSLPKGRRREVRYPTGECVSLCTVHVQDLWFQTFPIWTPLSFRVRYICNWLYKAAYIYVKLLI